MSITQDVVVLNDMGASSLSSRTRTTSSGDASVRYSIEMRADPILHDFNQENLGQGPAQAIRDGSDYLVVGRPIVAQPDPAAAARAILAQMREGA